MAVPAPPGRGLTAWGGQGLRADATTPGLLRTAGTWTPSPPPQPALLPEAGPPLGVWKTGQAGPSAPGDHHPRAKPGGGGASSSSPGGGARRGRGRRAYLAEAGFSGGPHTAPLIAAHNLLVWGHKVGVGRAGWGGTWLGQADPEDAGAGAGLQDWGGAGGGCREVPPYSLVGLHFPPGCMGLPL